MFKILGLRLIRLSKYDQYKELQNQNIILYRELQLCIQKNDESQVHIQKLKNIISSKEKFINTLKQLLDNLKQDNYNLKDKLQVSKKDVQ